MNREKHSYHLSAVRVTLMYIYSCSHIQFSGRYIHLLHAVLGHLTDNEKMVLRQTCDQLKPH